MSLPYLRAVEGGVEISIFVQPRASRTRLCGEHGGALKVQVAAPPVDGEANEELVGFFSKLFGVPRRQLELVAGEGGRRKRLRIYGVDAQAAERVMSVSP